MNSLFTAAAFVFYTRLSSKCVLIVRVSTNMLVYFSAGTLAACYDTKNGYHTQKEQG